MRNVVFVFIFFTSHVAFAQLPFISTWKTDNTGTSNSSSILITTNPNLTYLYDVDVDNDGVFDRMGITGDFSHDFGAPGTYTIRIRGTFPAITFPNDQDTDSEKLLDVSQWGDIQWRSFSSAFHRCINFNISATDAPDLSNVRTLANAFTLCSNFNSNINHWNVSTITDLDGTFQRCTVFNQPLDNWDVGNVESMRFTFADATAFNQNIGNWDVSKVRNMGTMFSQAESFNQDISSWQLDSLTNAGFMFRGASAFNQPLGSWVFPELTSLRGMFTRATSFNQDISTWDVSNITNFSFLFDQASSFDQDISGWDVSNGIEFDYMFNGARLFNAPITNWNVSNAQGMAYMFRGAVVFDQDISSWDVSNVTDMRYMFSQARIFNQDISSWNVGQVTTMQHMFSNTNNFNIDISGWNTSNVLNMSFMFNRAEVFNQDIGMWDVSKVETMRAMFSRALVFNQDLNNWDVSSVRDMSNMFSETPVFNSRLSNWNTSSVTDMQSMFFAARDFNQDISTWDVSNVTNMFRVFRQAIDFNQDISAWDVSNVINMREMLYGTLDFNHDLSSWDVSQVTDMSSMFFSCVTFDQNLGSWDVSNLEEANDMFRNVPLSIANYDSLLIGWAARDLNDTIDFQANLAVYCVGKEARQSMIDRYNWTFDDAGLENIAPTAICKDTTLYIVHRDSTLVLDPDAIGADSFDNCAPVSLSLQQTLFNCNQVNLTTTDTLWVDDGNGHITFCLAQITVLDTLSNLIVASPDDIELETNAANCSATVTWDEPLVRCNVVSINSNFNSGDAFPLGETVVEYTATDADGVQESVSFMVNVTTDLDVSMANVEAPLCDDPESGTILLSTVGGTAPYTYNWNEGAQVLSGELYARANAGMNAVIAYDQYGCSDTLEVLVPEPIPLELSLDTIRNDQVVEISAMIENGTEPLNYLWNDGSVASTFTADTTGWFGLSVTDARNCTDNDSVFVEFPIIIKSDLTIPNVFSPNGDAKNDIWEIAGIEDYEVIEISVFNRWGGLMFQSTGAYQPWDGRKNGKLVASATYYYEIKIEGTTPSGQSNFKGWVKVVR
ncbi:MAG: BspA family leucine-rich repeat surface protein [Bacteroidota bacterium]